jgi:uncharacterized protein (DUF2062 family)
MSAPTLRSLHMGRRNGLSQPGDRRRASHLNVLVPESVREFIRCRILRPLLRQLRGGVTPRRLAWSLALGVVIGINPSVGITTVLVVMLAWAFGLNQVASQLGAHAVAPLHLLLFIPFIELGVHLFHTRGLPLNRQQIERLSHHPLRLICNIWQWEWHALVVWGVVAAILMPLLAMYIRRALVLLMRRHRNASAFASRVALGESVRREIQQREFATERPTFRYLSAVGE